jgi:predicted transcriptional regulator with HTH domain
MRISNNKREKIKEQILSYLYLQSPKSIYTSYIAQEVVRDEEFTKKLLIELKEKNLVLEVKKNKEGKEYKRRSRWRLSEQAYNYYKQSQTSI